MLIDWSKPLHIPAEPTWTIQVIDPNFVYNELGSVVLLKISQPGKADNLTARHPLSNECPQKSDPFAGYLIENTPVVERGFWPLDSRGAPFGRGRTQLRFVWSEYPEATHAVEVVRHDGQPKEVHLHVKSETA